MNLCNARGARLRGKYVGCMCACVVRATTPPPQAALPPACVHTWEMREDNARHPATIDMLRKFRALSLPDSILPVATQFSPRVQPGATVAAGLCRARSLEGLRSGRAEDSEQFNGAANTTRIPPLEAITLHSRVRVLLASTIHSTLYVRFSRNIAPSFG